MSDAQSAGATIGPYEDLRPALDYLNRHFAESVTIETAAAQVHLSTSQFQRRFRALFQASPAQYLLQLHIDSACRNCSARMCPSAPSPPVWQQRPMVSA